MVTKYVDKCISHAVKNVVKDSPYVYSVVQGTDCPAMASSLQKG